MILKRFKAAPLSSSFFLLSILGLLMVVFYGPFNPSWSLALAIVFGAMFVASLISMSKAPIEAELEIEHMSTKGLKKKKK